MNYLSFLSIIHKQLQSMVFLNCGGGLDLTEKWFVAEKTSVRAYVFDNHRPIHHHNIADKNNVELSEILIRYSTWN